MKKSKAPKCKKCGESDPEKFYNSHPNKCIHCKRIIQNKDYYKSVINRDLTISKEEIKAKASTICDNIKINQELRRKEYYG